eukprot:Awhi_evm1s3061
MTGFWGKEPEPENDICSDILNGVDFVNMNTFDDDFNLDVSQPPEDYSYSEKPSEILKQPMKKAKKNWKAVALVIITFLVLSIVAVTVGVVLVSKNDGDSYIDAIVEEAEKPLPVVAFKANSEINSVVAAPVNVISEEVETGPVVEEEEAVETNGAVKKTTEAAEQETTEAAIEETTEVAIEETTEVAIEETTEVAIEETTEDTHVCDPIGFFCDPIEPVEATPVVTDLLESATEAVDIEEKGAQFCAKCPQDTHICDP